MYPKVKVREEKYQDDEHVAVGLQLLESLSLHDLSSPETEHKDVSPVFIARIPKSPLRNVVTLTNSTTHREQNHKKIDEREKPNIIRDTSMTDDSIALTVAEQNHKKIDEKEKPNIIGAAFLTDESLSTGAEKNDVKINEKEKQNIRASPILRPRAVLSSPDNDAVIGNKNRLKAERPVSLRDHDMIPNRHAKAKCKASPLHIKSQPNTTSFDDVPVNKSEVKGTKVTSRAVPSQRRDLRTWKF